jgi:multiple sugar transport system ATP-binding protein
MNFIRGRVIEDAGLLLDGGAIRLPLPRRAGIDFSGLVGTETVIGIRPEDLSPFDGAGDAPISAILDVAEPVGNETFLNLRAGEQTLVMRSPSRAVPAAGSPIAIGYRADGLHVFEPASGKRIELPQRP